MAKSQLPDMVKIGGKWYVPVVQLINTKDSRDRPKLVTCLHDDQSIELAGGEEFMIVYVPRIMLKKEKT